MPAVIFVDFPSYHGPRAPNLLPEFEDTVVPLQPVSAVTTVHVAPHKTRQVRMTQFPFITALALIPYKLQGMTVDGLVCGSLTDAKYRPPRQAAYIVFSRLRDLQSLAMLCIMSKKEIDYFKPEPCQMRELVRLHDLHLKTLEPRGVVDDVPLFPEDSGLDASQFRSSDSLRVCSSMADAFMDE